MIFTISAISAADSSTDAVGAVNSTVEVKSVDNDDDSLGMQDDVESLGDGETDGGTFAELSEKITNPSGTTVDLWNNYTFDASSSVITISTDNLVIDGHGVTTIDAKRYSSIFNVVASGVIIKNIKFINGYSTDSDTGGAISSTQKSVNIENCTFIDNQASSAGAIYTYYASSSIKDCTFINNKGSTAGAIFWEYAWGTIEKCIFINNTGNTAGAISVYSWYATNIKNSIFVNNAGGNEIYGYQYWYAINANYNWFGTTIDNYETNAPNVNDDVTLGGYYVLNFELDNDNGKAEVSLNNLYESGVLNTNYDAYELPPIDLNVKGKNIVVENSVSLVDGAGTIEFTPVDAYAITVNYNSVELIREVKPTFSMLKDKINSEGNEISLDQDYVYDSAKDSGLTNGIDFAKDVTIDGQGHVIDAKESSNIFYFNDNTDSYSLTLKNIIFANATGTDGAAVYFKGKKIEIINCTFINNAATSQGDAVYVADASSNENKIVESLFTGNTGSNSLVYVNLAASSSKLNLNNSIFVGNDATYNVKGTSNVIVDYNWWGNTIENYNDNNVAKVDGVTLNNWLILKIDATAAVTDDATISLNNVYDGSDVIPYDEYSLKPLTFTLSGSNARTSVSSITLDDNGRATYQFRMYKTTASLTATHENIATTKELEYTIVDDGSFKALNDIIWFSSANEVIELTHDYVYSESDTITEGIVIPRTITINGTGHKIDAKGETRIFDINGGVNNVNINDVNFVNANSTYGSVIIIRYGADYCNIKNCNFSNNTATSYAGAIDCIGDYCTIDNCNFINNTAASKAGAIRYYHDTQAYIKNSNFINNTVEEGGSGGGAIYGDDGKVSIDKSSFFNNSAKNMLGGAIYSKKAITISDSIILNSTGNYDIYDTSGITIQNSWVGNTFDNYNSAPNVYYLSSSSWLYLNIKFYEDFAIVSLNEAYSTSSGSSSVYSNYNLPEITLNINSTSLDLGGINKITLDGNGKAIVPYTKLSEDAKLTVSNEYVSLTKDCKIGDFDSLQYLIDTATGDTVELTRNYTFIENVDTLTNGISITRDITIDGKGLTINGSNLARILYITTNGVTLKNINFVDGYATHGGAIYNNGGSGFKLINCTFENNVAYNNPGGAIYTYSNGVNDFINCTFIGNKMTKANQFGGAVYIYEVSGQNNFIGCAFINNTAHYGGAIATASGKAITNIEKSVFVTNTANAYSSIYIKGGTSAEFYLKNSIIFSKGFTTDSSTQVYVASTLGAGDVNYNWWMHTGSNYAQSLYVRFSGVGLSVTKYLFLEIGCENEMATISLNNVYDTSSRTTSVYDEELPQITFDLSAVNAIVDSDVTLNKNGQGEVGCDLTDQSGSLTATYNSVSITTSLTSDDSFTTLQGKINRALEGSELVLYHDYNYDSTKDAALAEGIVIDKDLTIDGQGYAIDAKNAARIFKIDDNTKNIVLKNIKFVNAVADNGAAVYANCNNIEIVNCTFENNQATANGDALYLVTNGCEITESTFINNIGTVSTIYLDSELDHAPINIVNSILVNNDGTNIVKSTKVDLTADYNWWGNTVDNTNDLSEGLAQKWYVLDMTVDDTKSIASISLNNLNDGTSYENYALPTITLNMQATNGAVRKDEITLDENGDATVGYLATADGATLTVSYNGVSITREIVYNEESDYSFTALKKIIDQANDNDVITLKHDYEYVTGVDDAITAGIDITQNNLTINGNGYTIDAKEQTRVFNIGVADSLVASNVTIKNATFVNGKISGLGGAIRWNGWNGTLFNCTFENNSATNNGGAVYWSGQHGNVTNCTFKNNVVSGYNNGGAIHINTKNMNVVNSTFIENKASNGGSISINNENVTVINSTFIKSTASNGGAIFVAGSNVIINNSTFTSNEATSNGGAVYLSSGNNIDIVDSKFNDDKATSYAGAIYSNTNFNIKNSTFKGNKANYAGAVYYANSGGGTIYNATFIDNSANRGGAIYIYSGIVDINKTDFINNNAQGSSAYGGVIYDQSSGKLSIENSNFTSNYVKTTTSTAYGGAIYSGYGDISIANSTFNRNSIDSNSGSTYGSVIWFGNSAKGEILNSSFLNNHGKSSFAAAMYGTGSGVEVNVINSIFLNNTYSTSNTLKVVHSASSAAFIFTDCWFGNTKDNSGADMGTTIGTTITYNNKLDLATEHDEYMVVGEDRQIKFVFKYTENGKSLIYDSSKLPKVNLTLSSVNGDLDKNSASMDETILFNADQFGSASITGKYNGIELTENLYAKDKPTIIVEEPIVVHVTETVEVNVVELIPAGVDLQYSAIDGDEFIFVASNGYVQGLKEGTSTLYVTFNGNDDYAPATVEVPVTVIKYTTSITTNLTETEPVDSITVDWGADSQNIIIGFDNGNTDFNPDYPDAYDVFTIKHKSNDTNVATVSIVNQKPVINFHSAGTANVTFYFEGNEKYYASEKNITVTVRKVDSSVEFSNDVELEYLGSGLTTLTLTGCSVDLVNISVVGHDEAVIGYDVDAKVVSVSGLDAGSYTLKVTTTPDDNHKSVDATVDITVNKIDSSVGFADDVEFDYLGSGSTTLVDFVGCTVDLVNITVVGHDEAVIGYDVDAKVVSVSGLDAGSYTLKVTTTPDGNHKSVDATVDIKVNKIDSSVIFSNEITFAYEDEGSTIATCTGCTIDFENVTVIGHPEAVIKVEGNKITVSGLDENEYTLKVITTPDDNHKSIETTLKVIVSGISPKMEMQVSNITVGEKEIVFVTMSTEATGIVNITILQGNEVIQTKNITIKNRFNKTEFTGLKVGEYTITAYYYGSQNYNTVTIPDKFTVHPIYNFEFSADVDDTVYGNATNITVNLSPDATGSIKIGNQETHIEGAVTVIELPIQNIAGKNNVIVKYIPDADSKYGASELVVYYNVAKKSTEITIADISGIKVGDDVEIIASAYDGANIVFYVDGVKLDSNTLEDVSAGSHTIVASVDETDNWLSASANKTFTVTKHNVDISVSGTPAKVGEKSTITVTCNADEGIVVINVNGTEYSINLAETDTMDVVMPNVGSAPLTAKYLENYKYNAKDADASAIEVSDKIKSEIKVDVPESIKVDDVVTINVTTSNPELEVTINGEKQTVIDGKITFTAAKAGIYNIVARTNETEDTYGEVKFASFEVSKKSIEIKIEDITGKKVDDDVTIDAKAYPEALIVLYVDGKKLDSNIIENVAAGNHTIIASVAETDKYMAANANKTFEVTKYDVEISVSGTETAIGENSTIAVDANVNEGIVVINVDGVEYSLDLAKGNTVKVVMNKIGTVPLSARYIGNDKYNAKDAKSATIIVTTKRDSKIDVGIPDEIKVGDVVTINVTTSNPELEVTINGEKQTVTDGKVTFTAIKAGIYDIVALTNETKDFFGETVFKSFEVRKNTAEIAISQITPKMVDDEVIIEITSYDGADIVIYVDGVKQTLADNEITIKATYGAHTIIASIEETDKYTAASANKTFTVSKYDVDISVSATPVYIGQKSTVTVDANATEGIVIVNVNGTEYSLDLSKGNTLEIIMDNAGSIPLTAKYLENYKCNAKDAESTSISVTEKEKSSITIQVNEVSIVGDEMKINVTTNGDNLTVNVLFDGVIQKTANGNFTFTPQKDGVYTIVAKTTENDTCYGSEKTVSFAALNRTKEVPSIIVSKITDVKVCEEIAFTVDVSAGGNPIVKVNDEIITPEEGVYKFTPQKGGLFVLTVETPENEKYTAGSNITTFTVEKKQAKINIIVSGTLEVDKLIKVDIESYDDADIVAFVDGNSLDWEKADKYLSGDHFIIATVAENDQYYGTTANHTFNVAKKSSNIRVLEDYATVGQKATIEISLPSDATGIVIFDVNGTEYSVNISETRLFEIAMNNVGEIPFTAKYIGDEKYLPSNDSNRIFVKDKTPAEISISEIGVVYAGDNVTVEITSTSDANLVVCVDGVKQTLENGKLTINNIASGIYVIDVVSPETSQFKYNSTNKIINVDKRKSEVSIMPPETINIGDDVYINISSTSDADIIVYVDGAKQTINGGKITIKATAGVHTIIATVDETDKYLPSTANKSFTVDKLDEQISISGTDITEGQNTTITIGTEISEGIVVVKINGTEMAVDLAKTKSISVQLNAPGSYELSAIYLGSDIHNPVEASKSTVNVAKKQTPEVNVEIPEIKANETESISISIPNATGDVHVIIDGVDEVIHLDENGNATYTLPRMSAGNHSAVIVYSGDEKNDEVIKSVPFTVSKQETKANITSPKDVKEGDSATVKVEIANATGDVVIIVDGVEDKVPLVNGTVNYPLDNLSAGNHSVVVIYPGDDTHSSAYSASSFNVEAEPVVVKLATELTNITIASDLNITAYLVDENGKPISNAEIIYLIGDDSKSIFTAQDGSFTI